LAAFVTRGLVRRNYDGRCNGSINNLVSKRFCEYICGEGSCSLVFLVHRCFDCGDAAERSKFKQPKPKILRLEVAKT